MKDLFDQDKIRTLGLYQPFASLMAFGKIETRWVGKSKLGNWKQSPFPLGKYLIYSCQKAYDVFDNGLTQTCTPEQILQIEELWNNNDSFFCEFGSALIIGDLVRIVDPLPQNVENTFVKYEPPTEEKRRVGLVFENVRRIKPFPFKGNQGVGILSDSDKARIEYLE